MSPKKTKKSEKKVDKDVESLMRQPLYPDVSAEKENMEVSDDSPEKFRSNLSLSDDSPEKVRSNLSPRMPRNRNLTSSTDSMRDIPGSPKRKSGIYQQNQQNNLQDCENYDVDMETDNFVDTNYFLNQGQENREISPDFKKHLLPKSDRIERRKELRRSIQPESQTVPSASKSNSSHSSGENSIYVILLCLFICFIIPFVYWQRSSDTPSTNNQFNASTLVKSLKSEFKDQPPLTFRIIHSALRNVLDKQPEAPAIILLLATNGSETVCSEFAHRLVDLLTVPQFTVKISGKDYRQANTNNAKMEIDKTISKTLKDDQLGSVLIDDLDQIPGKAALIFYKYYDHENAPHKRAVFVMTVNYNKAISDFSDTKKWDKVAYDHLLSVWTDIGVDQVTPLLTRLTVSVAVIKT